LKSNMSIKCPSCMGSDLVFNRDKGELICRKCGTVLYMDNIDLGPEWRAYSEEHVERRKRIGAPLSYMRVDLGLLTYPTGEDSRNIKQLSQVHLSYRERKLQNILNEIERLGERLKLRKFEKETAAQIVRKTVSQSLVRKRYRPATIAAASILLSCRLYNSPVSLREIIKAVMDPKVKDTHVSKIYRSLTKALNIKVKFDADQQLLNLVFRKMDNQFDPIIYNTAAEILRSARKIRIGTGKSPNSLVGAAIYLSLKLNGIDITQSEIAKLANTTEVTVRARIKELMSNLDIVLDI